MPTRKQREEALDDFRRLVARLALLKDRLREASSAPSKIERVLGSLAGVLDFLHSFDDLEQLSGPLAHLSDSLVDLQNGSHPELLKPKIISRRPKSPRAAMHLRAACVTCMAMLMEMGESKKASAETVARAFGGVTATQVAGWRDNAKRNGDDKETGARVTEIRARLPKPVNLNEARSMVEAIAKAFRRENSVYPPLLTQRTYSQPASASGDVLLTPGECEVFNERRQRTRPILWAGRSLQALRHWADVVLQPIEDRRNPKPYNWRAAARPSCRSGRLSRPEGDSMSKLIKTCSNCAFASLRRDRCWPEYCGLERSFPKALWQLARLEAAKARGSGLSGTDPVAIAGFPHPRRGTIQAIVDDRQKGLSIRVSFPDHPEEPDILISDVVVTETGTGS
jgi:transposase-like protein